ncbi:MAG: cytochrome C [Bacteroidia bacterium]|nr:cytochrome C [Bacteroidia bacterium]
MQNFLPFLLLPLFLFACTGQPIRHRPIDPWIIRSVLDQQPRMLTLALDTAMYVAYSAQTGQLYKIWKGGIHLEGAAYNDVKTVQPESWGTAYWETSPNLTPWKAEKNGKEIPVDMRFGGYRVKENRITLMYEFRSGTDILAKVEEQPEFEKKTDSVAFIRTFKLNNPANGIQIRVYDGKDYISLSAQSPVSIRYSFPPLPHQTKPERSIVGHVGEYWLDRSGCNTCHREEETTIGPGYREIAARYEPDKETVEKLVKKIQTGGSGQWGQTVMIPHPQLGDKDLRTMVDYILSLEPRLSPEKKSSQSSSSLSEYAPSPGFGAPLESVHPAYDVTTIHPENFKPRVGGLAFLPDGRLLVTTWDSVGGVYILEGVETGDSSKITVKRFAEGLSEPLGITVVEGEIFVLQKHELTQLIDEDGDDIADVYKTICNTFGATADFHEFAYGLVWKDGYFYANLGLAMRLMANELQHPDRGKTIKIRKDGTWEEVASGLRQCNGIGIGPEGEIFLTENQGQWVPACKIIHLREGDFHGCQFGWGDTYTDKTITPPALWLPHDEIANSPGEPVLMQDGPYAGQMLFGEVTHGGIKRVFLEKIKGEYRGCVFRFTQGLEAGINRMRWGPDGGLYAGGVGMNGNWGWNGKKYGLQRLKYNGKSVFEMLAIRQTENGFEVAFTEPLAEDAEEPLQQTTIQQWYYKPTSAYGGPKLGLETLKITHTQLSSDRRKITLTIPGLKEGHVVYFLLNEAVRSHSGQKLWSGEAWYSR